MAKSPTIIQTTLFDESDILSRGQNAKVDTIDSLPEYLMTLGQTEDLVELKNRVTALRNSIQLLQTDHGFIKVRGNGQLIDIRKEVLLSELDQIVESHTLPRANYYLKRLVKSFNATKVGKINDINLLRWKEYDDIITDSLWIMKKRDTSGGHLGWYWGNFVPQIANQLMKRYTKKGDWIFDPFVGSGTTLIECRRLGRNGIGVELNGDVVEKARLLVNKEENVHNVVTDIVGGDSATINIDEIANKYRIKKCQLIIAHPPYHDIINFSDDKRDLSRATSVQDFLDMFGRVVDNVNPLLEVNRYFTVVIGDKYTKGEWIPLGFYCMNEVLKRGYLLRSIIVKNFDETRAKRSQEELWRYRALVGGFYIFKHEYILVFKKLPSKRTEGLTKNHREEK